MSAEQPETKEAAAPAAAAAAEAKKEDELLPVMQAIMERHSVRNYAGEPSDEEKAMIARMMEEMPKRPNVFDPEKSATHEGLITLHYVPKDLGFKATYGVIQGTKDWMFGVSLSDEVDKYARERYGLLFQRVINELTRRHLGTVWLGGTFGVAPFADEIGGLKEGQRIIAVSPVGKPGSPGMLHKFMKWMISSTTRVAWDTMFFDGAFGKPLTQEAAGEEYAQVLEALHRAPSARNMQPWRVVRRAGERAWDFYVHEYGFFARVDIGIGMANWEMACEDLKLPGHWAVLTDVPADAAVPENTAYVITWLQD